MGETAGGGLVALPSSMVKTGEHYSHQFRSESTAVPFAYKIFGPFVKYIFPTLESVSSNFIDQYTCRSMGRRSVDNHLRNRILLHCDSTWAELDYDAGMTNSITD